MYQNMDGSEKGVVSYLLGMTTSMAFARHYLGFPWLVHVDRVLRVTKADARPSGPRPDLLGMNRLGDLIVVESKGRSGPRDTEALRGGKSQIENSRYRFLPAVSGGLLAEYVNHSFFDAADRPLQLVVKDPEGEGAAIAVERALIAALYYVRIVSLIDGGPRWPDDNGTSVGTALLGAGVTMEVSREIHEQVHRAAAHANVPVRQLEILDNAEAELTALGRGILEIDTEQYDPRFDSDSDRVRTSVDPDHWPTSSPPVSDEPTRVTTEEFRERLSELRGAT